MSVIRSLAVCEIGGVLRHPRTPFCARVGTPASLWWQRSATEHRASLPATFQAARCDVHRPATRIDPCPGGGGGQGIECLSDQRFQLILLQACAEFPFHAFSHFLPGPSGYLHLLEHVKCLCQGAVLGIFPVHVPSPKGPCHFPTYRLRQCSLVHGFFQGHDWVFQAAGPIPVGTFATGTSGWFFGATRPPGLSTPMTDLLTQFYGFLISRCEYSLRNRVAV